MACFEAFNNMCKKIVCPVRHQLNQDEMIERKFRSSNVLYEKLQVKNTQGQTLSLVVFEKSFSSLPTVLYLHGNGGHKLESLQIAFEQINLIAFDFCGCGKSQGEFITYGKKEVEDIRSVIDFVTEKYKIKKIALWGRSMGASLAIMYTAKYPQEINCMILDSPFRYLKKVVFNVAQQSSKSIPTFLINFVVYLVQKKTQSLVGSNVFSTDFSQSLQRISIPILFVFSTKDTVVKQEDVQQLHNIYKGPKSMSRIQSLHHQDRPKSLIEAGCKFICQAGEKMEKGNKFSGKIEKGRKRCVVFKRLQIFVLQKGICQGNCSTMKQATKTFSSEIDINTEMNKKMKKIIKQFIKF